MFEWFANTLRTYPEIAIFLSLAFGYYFGSFTYKGLGLGAVTATLIAAVVIGQLGITVTGPLKPFFFLMFLFAIGYAVGPQFVRGIAKDGLPQALYAGVVCVFCLLSAWLVAKIAGYHAGRLRDHVYLRHGWFGGRHCPARPHVARHRSRRGMPEIRGEARRQEGGRWPRHGLAPVRAARLPRAPGRPHRWYDGRGGRTP